MQVGMNRRTFLGTTTAGAVSMIAGRGIFYGTLLAAEGGDPPKGEVSARADWPPKMPPVNIYTIYAGTSPAWPKPDLNLQGEMSRLNKKLDEVERKVGDVKFVGRELVRFVPADPKKLAEKLAQADGVLVFNLTTIVQDILQPIIQADRPTVIFSQPYSGHDWSWLCTLPGKGRKVVLLATSDFNDLAEAARVMRAPARLARTRLVCVSGSPVGADTIKNIKDKTGVEVVSVTAQELNKAYDQVDSAVAEAQADKWIRKAIKVVEPTRDEIVKSSKLYLAMKAVMQQQQARAITVDCLGLFGQKVLPAYPCLGFCQLNDMGLVGACEADIDSTLTMLMFGYAFGVPGFISDPVFDTSTNTVIHAHCVCPTKMDGPAGPSCPYIIRNHLEDYKGAVLQVKHRKGQPITCAKLVNNDTIVISTGKITGSPDVDRGCRTKMATKVADARKMLDNWGGGVVKGGIRDTLHRVVFYGNHIDDVRRLAVLMGLKVVEEV